MSRRLTTRRALLLLVVLPAVAVVRYVDHEPTRTIVGVVGLVAVAVGLALVVREAARRRAADDQRRGGFSSSAMVSSARFEARGGRNRKA